MTTWLPHVTVATVIEDDGRFLLVEELANGERVFNQPAGHLDPNETLIEAAIRETLEETGWHVEITALLGMSLYTAPSNNVTYHRTCFIGKAISHEQDYTLDNGIIGPAWMTYEDIERANNAGKLRSPLVLKTIDTYLRGQSFSLEALYD